MDTPVLRLRAPARPFTGLVSSLSAGSISSEELIKYAHRISASNAVCAPLNWVPGRNQGLSRVSSSFGGGTTSRTLSFAFR